MAEFVLDTLHVSLAEDRQVATLGRVLVDQTIEVLVAAALPGTVRNREVTLGVQRNVAKRWSRPIQNCAAARNQFAILFGARMVV